jgi:hypothetical protein
LHKWRKNCCGRGQAILICEKKKSRNRVRNWPEYNKSIKQRGNIGFRISADALASWNFGASVTAKAGRPQTYSDLAIECMATLKEVYGMKLRQAEGFVQFLLNALRTGLKAPCYTTLSRRRRRLAIHLPHTAQTLVCTSWWTQLV